MYYTKSYKTGHPNPIFARNSFKILDGIWNFKFDTKNEGIDKKWEHKFPSDCLSIEVPYVYQSQKGLNIKTQENDIVWYNRRFSITKIFDKTKLVFLGCDYHLEAFINGVLVGSHDGGYDTIVFDVSNLLVIGENEITLRVTDSTKKDQIRGKQTSKDEPYSCFYEGVTGIYKSVYLEFLSSSYLDSFKIDASYENKCLSFFGIIKEFENKFIQLKITDNNGDVYLETFKLLEENFSKNIQLLSIRPWSNDSPKLYDLIISILDEEGNVLDEVFSYVGFKDVYTKGGRMYINGVDTYFKSVLFQGYYHQGFYTGNDACFRNDITAIARAGFNGIRIHQKIADPKFLYFADANGFYCTLEIPSANEFSIDLTKNYFKEVDNIVKDNYNHPCYFSLILFNESWGVNKIKNDKVVQEFVNSCYFYYKKMCPKWLILSNDGWEHTISDICSVHNYEPDGEHLKKFEMIQYQELLKKGNCLANESDYMAYSQGYKYCGQPIFLSEFGGIGLQPAENEKEVWSYGAPMKDADEFINRLSKLYHGIRECEFIRGICYTQFNDVYPEMNGFVTIKRKPKFSLKTLKELNDLLV